MSSTEIYGFDKNGYAYFEDEVTNSWRGAMAIWNILEKKYLPPYRPTYVPKYIEDEDVESFCGFIPSRTNAMDAGKSFQEIIDLFYNNKVSDVDKTVLLSTLDYVIVMKEDFPKLISAFKEFEGETSLKEQAYILEKMFSDENCIAAGFNQTSVNASSWINYGGYDKEKDEMILYNIFTGNKHWNMFKEE